MNSAADLERTLSQLPAEAASKLRMLLLYSNVSFLTRSGPVITSHLQAPHDKSCHANIFEPYCDSAACPRCTICYRKVAILITVGGSSCREPYRL